MYSVLARRLQISNLPRYIATGVDLSSVLFQYSVVPSEWLICNLNRSRYCHISRTCPAIDRTGQRVGRTKSPWDVLRAVLCLEAAVYLLPLFASSDPHRSCEVDHDVNCRRLRQLLLYRTTALLLARVRACFARLWSVRRSISRCSVGVERRLEQSVRWQLLVWNRLAIVTLWQWQRLLTTFSSCELASNVHYMHRVSCRRFFGCIYKNVLDDWLLMDSWVTAAHAFRLCFYGSRLDRWTIRMHRPIPTIFDKNALR